MAYLEKEDTYSELNQTSKMELLVRIVNSSNLDIWYGSPHVSGTCISCYAFSERLKFEVFKLTKPHR